MPDHSAGGMTQWEGTGLTYLQVDKLSKSFGGFKALCDGDYDHLPEAAFYMVGTIESAVEKAERLAAEAA